MTIDVGGAAQTFILNKKGKANNGGGNKFSLQPKLKNGVTKAGRREVLVPAEGRLQGDIADYGLVDAIGENVPVTVPRDFTAGPRPT